MGSTVKYNDVIVDPSNPTKVLKRYYSNGVATNYFISEQGDVYNTFGGLHKLILKDTSDCKRNKDKKTGKWIKYNTKNYTYFFKYYSTLDKKSHAVRLPKAVYQTFIGPIPDNYEIHHIDLNPLNNVLSNLLAVDKPTHRLLHKLVKNNYNEYLLKIEELKNESN